MPLGTVRVFAQRCVCAAASVLITLAITFGSMSFVTAATGMGMDAVSDAAPTFMRQACRTEMGRGGPQASCTRAEDTTPPGDMVCPMLGRCVNMVSGMGHCALMGLMGLGDIRAGTAAFAAIRYLRVEVPATGLPAEPYFHPPIL